MSGPFGSSQWMYASGGFYGTEIAGSLRFNNPDQPRLTRAVTHNTKTFTINFWVKRANLGRYWLYGVYSNSANTANLNFEADGTLVFYDYLSGYRFSLVTTRVFRDVGAWYCITLSVDTTQSTASDRIKLYINGVQETSFSTATYPSQNLDLKFGGGGTHAIGTEGLNNRLWWDGYLANWALIDGQQLEPSSFGEFKSGIWVPKNISGLTYGTGGYLLEFAGNTNDTSGNSNNWTANNISAYDYVPDSPTNNFATMNSLSKAGSGAVTLSEGNLKVAVADNANARSGFVMDTGKWYWEAVVVGGATVSNIGIAEDGYYSGNLFDTGSSAKGYIYLNDGNKRSSLAASATAYGASYTTNDIIGVAYDADNGTVTFYKNNTTQGTAYTGLSGGHSAYFQGYGGTATWVANFGQDSSFAGNKTAQGNTDANGKGDFYYSPPSGYLALCSANLPDPAINPADDVTPEDYFNTVLYSGNGTSQSITGVGFSPDALWIKERSSTSQHQLFHDIDGGTPKFLQPSTNIAEVTDAQVVSSFDADGFSVGNSGGSNQSGQTYVAWNWYTGATPTSNTDGSITSTVSANPDAGFSVVTYTRTTSGSDTIGHGLSSAPEVVIYKSRASAADWYVTHTLADGSYDFLRLNQQYSNSNVTGASAPTSSVFSNTIYGSAENFVAYCFHSVDGYLKCGKYTGNGSGDGSFIYTGFRPAFILIKRTDGVENWVIYDTVRDTYNELDSVLYPNLSNAEWSGTSVNSDALSNGFKLRDSWSAVNASGANYIYMAFAEQPFKYANAR